ncbi:hypothetical protein, conserved [Trypanosoma brucei gambiense DAL972]|uniref:Dynamin N-terminal domain-containing protein n=1 Tax=Trypanosoma brucei gambiense (strain MHOM/CI/86/DAL972) TaxID=679716 RepID=C9ZRK6_TRYB9|nr:hypothetical protein, conserved [Trypanosoma brucei gambiense DAL972]CBH12308.1 hypothetical protein, conserved [Trypanosoma brucei gambiense DAL972]|eukprot:XP_011774589.1 hypothetical protein, conserved [Trypanosoma brucei gambiense DAL972]
MRQLGSAVLACRNFNTPLKSLRSITLPTTSSLKRLLRRSQLGANCSTNRMCFATTTTVMMLNKFGLKSSGDESASDGYNGIYRMESGSNKSGQHALESVEEDLNSLKRRVQQRYSDELRFLSHDSNRQPMVIVLGNHSAGKSTMINRLLGIELQRSGVSPTDDGFTVIQSGEDDITEDGPTAVSDPRYSFQELRKFGIHFVNKFKVKTRKLPATSLLPPGLMIVDTPDMIDTPIHLNDRTSVEGQLRGYDLFAVTRWFASRCDLIILMFDPANPGTTGETLDVLTKSLAGVEHKLLIVLNKSDMYDKAADFARVYGVLCWNLSKVLQMKDIPHIYTTYFLPRGDEFDDTRDAAGFAAFNKSSSTEETAVGGRKTASGSPQKESTSIIARDELLRQRSEVVSEILQAPLRRYDNLITELEEGVKRVLLAGRVCTEIVSTYRKMKVVATLAPPAIFCVSGLLLAVGGFTEVAALLASATAIAAVFAALKTRKSLVDFENDVLTNIDVIFDRLYVRHEKTMDTQLRWKDTVKPEILEFLNSSSVAGRQGIASLPTLSKKSQDSIISILKNDIPQLRVRVANYKVKNFLRAGERQPLSDEARVK